MNKTKNILLIIAFTFASGAIWAQPGGGQPKDRPNGEMRKRIESARIALITERLDLSPEQAQQFWPVYNQFSNERRAVQKELREANKKIDPKTASEKELKALLDLQMQTKQKGLDIEKKYSSKLLNVISTRQLAALRKAEGDFHEMIRNRIKQNQAKRRKMGMKGQNRQRMKRPGGL